MARKERRQKKFKLRQVNQAEDRINHQDGRGDAQPTKQERIRELINKHKKKES